MSSRLQGRWASGRRPCLYRVNALLSSLGRATCPPGEGASVRLNSPLLWHCDSQGEALSGSLVGSQALTRTFQEVLGRLSQVAALPPSPSVFASDFPLASDRVGGPLSALALTGCAVLEGTLYRLR